MKEYQNIIDDSVISEFEYNSLSLEERGMYYLLMGEED